jgi:site-specific DNA recombinase
MINAAILCRVSTEGQRENTSLADQRRILTELADRQGWAWEVFDEVESGGAGVANRPVLAQILGRIAAGEFQRLVVLVPDRLSRAGVGELEQISATLARVGARLVTQAGEIDPSNLDHGLILDMQGVMAKNERLRIRDRTIRGREAIAKAGGFTGHPVPFGWRRVWQSDGSTVIEVDEVAAAVVRGMFEAYATGSVGAVSIANDLNARGITLHGRPWSGVAVRRILASNLYQGVQEWRAPRRQHATDLPRFHVASTAFPAIVNPDLWQACAAVRSRRASAPKPPSAGDWPLTGILRCPECDGSMAASMAGTKVAGGPYWYYRCGRSACKRGRMVRADVAHRVVFDAVGKATAWAASLPAVIADDDSGDLAGLRAQLAACDRQEKDLWRQKQAGMDEDQWRRLNGIAMEDRGRVEAAIRAAERQRPVASGAPIGEVTADPAWLDSRADLRELFVAVFERVILYPHGSSKRPGSTGPAQGWRVGRATLVDGHVWR